MACDPNCSSAYSQGGMGCGGGMMGPADMGGMGYPGAGRGMGCCQPGPMGYEQGPPPMGYQQGPPPMGYQQGPPPMGYPQGAMPMGYQQGPTPMGYQQGPTPMSYQQGPLPMGYQQPPMGYNPFEPGSGCGGLSIACGPQDADIPPQAHVRKPRPPSSNIPKRKVGQSYTTLVTPLAGAKKLVEEETNDIPPDHERFDTLTLAFGTKPGTDKPPKILLTLKSPKVIDAKLGTGTAGTQVYYRDLGLPDPNAKPEDTKSRAGSRGSKRSKLSVSTRKSKSSKAKKPSKGKKGKK